MTNDQKPKRRGRPPHKPTEQSRRQAKLLSGYGLTRDEIAAVIGISTPTLDKHYGEDLDAGAPELTAQVAQSLFRAATDKEKPNVVAAIFWLKCRAGWDDSGGKTAGKKAQRQQEAAEVANKFAVRRGNLSVIK